MPEKPRRSPTASVPGLVKDLVDQFSDPLAFYRELIQNAIDAGSNRIDVTLEYLTPGSGAALPEGIPGSGPGGVARIAVEDDGEGMDERIIDDYFLVLFRSTKEGDLTKIGKFGIGVVSVFSLRPDLVRVHTAKAGESWRLDFPSYQRYDKYRVAQMREGTLVELFKRMGPTEYEALAQDSLKTVRFWCRHSDTRIYFQERRPAAQIRVADGRPCPINEPFGLEGGVSLGHVEEGTEIAIGFSPEAKPFCGYYNRGLTLKEARHELYPGVAFKIKSRYLEHTLTRDNVLEDANYRKAMGIVDGLVSFDLPAKAKEELGRLSLAIASRAAAGQPADPAAVDAWRARLPYLRWLFSGFLTGTLARWKSSSWPLLPTVGGKVVSMGELKKSLGSSDGAIYVDAVNGDVPAALTARGCCVLVQGPWVDALCGLWFESGLSIVTASEAFMLPRLVPEGKLDGGLRAFLRTLASVDATTGARYKSLGFADFGYPGSSIAGRIFVTQREPGGLSRLDDRPAPSLFSVWRARRHALINAEHPFVRSLARVHQGMPGLAAYMCLKVMHLNDGDVPVKERGRYSNLAERAEARLLEAGLRLDKVARR